MDRKSRAITSLSRAVFNRDTPHLSPISLVALGLMWASWVRVDFQPAQAAPMHDQQPYRMLIRHSIARLASCASHRLRFDQVGDVFPPGMVGNDIHPGALSDLRAFAEDVGYCNESRQAEDFRFPQATRTARRLDATHTCEENFVLGERGPPNGPTQT